jgi:hypothetical protein
MKIRSSQFHGTGITVNGILPSRSGNCRGEEDPAQPACDWTAEPVLWLASEESRDVFGGIFTGSGIELPAHDSPAGNWRG